MRACRARCGRVAMSGYHPGRVGGGGSKRAAHQLVDLMTSISTPQAPQSRSAGSSLQQKDAQRVSPGRLAAQLRARQDSKGWAESTAMGRDWRSSRCLGREQRRAQNRAVLLTVQLMPIISSIKRSPIS